MGGPERSDELVAQLRREFTHRFKSEPRIFRAPGRVNLIGEHTDYNDGWVLPAAIDFSTWVAIASRSDLALHIVSLNLGEERAFSLANPAPPAQDWSDYVRGVVVMLGRNGFDVRGANLMISGNVPMGAGLSSSASLEVATALALLETGGSALPPKEIALLCQRAENEFVGMRCGIMDQFVAVHGRAGNALMLDCRDLTYELLPLPPSVTIVICNSMVKHQLAAGQYNTRRAECELGVQILQRAMPSIRALRDVSPAELEEHKADLPPAVYRRCRHVVGENARVLQFARALKAGDLAAAGLLLGASHASLRDDYEVSCRELDLLVDMAQKIPGNIGSRMTGGGFGGCTVSLVRDDAVEHFREEVATQYEHDVGVKPEIYVTQAAEGAGEVE